MLNATRERAAHGRRWSTSDVSPRQALAYWRDSICDVMLELEIEAPQGESFNAELRQHVLGPALANFVHATPQRVARTRGSIARSRHAVFHLVHLRAGEFQLDHRGRSTQLRAGECVLIDSREPHLVHCPQATRCLVLQMPHEWLCSWLRVPQQLSGTVLRGPSGWAGALAATLSNLEPESLDELALPGGVVVEQVAALLTLAAGPEKTEQSRQERLYARLERALRDRYHDSGLAPASVAAGLGISVRYLHLLFAQRRTTFGAQLLALRLERARQLLSSARLPRAPIGEIAARCGFCEASHFARRFRARFGLAPAAYRAQLHRERSPAGTA